MGYRKFTAGKIFTGNSFSEVGSVLISNEDGVIEDIVPLKDAGDDVAVFNGIISPGFINAHCHLELSHLKDVIPPHTGLIEFLCSVVGKRDFPQEVIQQKIVDAEQEMYEGGIVAVGDIGNTADTLMVKSRSKIRWQNFVEVLSFTDAHAEKNFNHYKQVAAEMEAALHTSNIVHRTSLVPHAPYSISPKTFQLINEATAGQVISIHNQEHPAEDELYKTGGGDYLRFFKKFGVDQSPFPVTGKSSLRSCLPYFTSGQTVFLIHNTYTPEEDVQFAQEYAAEHGLKIVFCLCINANLYIENKVPLVEMLMKNNAHLVLGTDSYSSNWQLSILSELKTVHERFPSVPLATILQWATLNGASALQWEDQLGSFEKGKQPGIINIAEDLSTVKRLL